MMVKMVVLVKIVMDDGEDVGDSEDHGVGKDYDG